MQHLRSSLSLAIVASVALGCHNPKEQDHSRTSSSVAPSSSVSARASAVSSSVSKASKPPHPVAELPKAQDVSIETPGGFSMKASYWPSDEPNRPALLLAHSLGGDRNEWTPVLRRLAASKLHVSILSVDLRGHGQSANKKKTWKSLSPAAFAKLGDDLLAAIRWLEHRPKHGPSSLVLAGSDLGANALVQAIDKHKKGVCVAGALLVSPGAKLQGLDIYRPFRALIDVPVLLVASKSDTISNEPITILGKMGTRSQKVVVDGSRHGLRFMSSVEVWDPMAEWLDKTIERGCGSVKGVASAAPSSAPAASAR